MGIFLFLASLDVYSLKAEGNSYDLQKSIVSSKFSLQQFKINKVHLKHPKVIEQVYLTTGSL